MVQQLPDGPLYPGPGGVHTHGLRHRFASEALDASPRELANISQVLGHDSVETTLRFISAPAPTPNSASAR